MIETASSPYQSSAGNYQFCTAKDLARNIKKEYRGRQILPTPSGDQEMVVISTPGLFHALMNSRKVQAEPFQKWVLGEVLPGIARDGAYIDTANQIRERIHDLPNTRTG